MLSVVNRFLTFITASMAVLGEKLGGGPTDHLAGLGVVSRALFSWKQEGQFNVVNGLRKVATYVDCP
jgi:hypothetical protein